MATKRDFVIGYGLQADKSAGLSNTLVVDYQNDRVGVGTGSNTPAAKLHISDGNNINANLLTSDYTVISAQSTSPGFNIISSGNGVLDRGVFKATRSRGTLASPTAPQSGDAVFTLLGAVYDGSTTLATAGVQIEVDNPVSSGVAPQRVSIYTGNTNTRVERLRVTSIGNVGINSTGPNYLLDVNGDTRITSENKMRFGGTSNASNFYIQYNATANSLDFVSG
jgi:hypothetical protein